MTGPRVLAIANQKGGVGKTTTAINLSAGLVELGATVLLVDIDPQGNASTGLGIDIAKRGATTYDLLVERMPLSDVVRPTAIEGLRIAPANADLSSADLQLMQDDRRSLRLRDVLRDDDPMLAGLDFVVIDCPPSLSLLTVNALLASDAVLVPLQSEFFALEGLSQLLLTIRDIREGGNPDLRLEGVVLTMHDRRNNLSQQVERDVRQTLGDLVFQTVVPRNVRVSEAPSFAMPVLAYDGGSKGALAYRALAQEVMARYRRLRSRMEHPA